MKLPEKNSVSAELGAGWLILGRIGQGNVNALILWPDVHFLLESELGDLLTCAPNILNCDWLTPHPRSNFKPNPFWQARRASGLHQIKKLNETKNSFNLIVSTVPSMKNTQIHNFYFYPKAPRVVPLEPWGASGQNVALNKMSSASNFSRGPFKWKILKFQNLVASPTFWSRFLRTWHKN